MIPHSFFHTIIQCLPFSIFLFCFSVSCYCSRAAKLAGQQSNSNQTTASNHSIAPLSPSSASASPDMGGTPIQSPSSKKTFSSLPPKPHTPAASISNSSKVTPINTNITPPQTPAAGGDRTALASGGVAAAVAAIQNSNSRPVTSQSTQVAPAPSPTAPLQIHGASASLQSPTAATSSVTPASPLSASASPSTPVPASTPKSSSTSSSFISLPYPLLCLSLVILTVSYFWFGRRSSS